MVHYQGVFSFEFQTTQRNQGGSNPPKPLANHTLALIEIDQTKRASESKLYLYQKKRQQL